MSLGIKIGIGAFFVIIALLPLLAVFATKKGKAKTAVTGKDAAYHAITPVEAKEMMDMDKNKEIILIDVRTQEEYSQGRIAGSINIPESDIAQASDRLPDKDAEIVVYCRSGARSQRAAKQLAALGYANVYDMGGIMSWPYETVR